ncbi:unnamed protein product, partial [Scytosiphon promiscuus]
MRICRTHSLDSEERVELDALRLENDTLRTSLERLEDKVQRAEEKAREQAQQQEIPPGGQQSHRATDQAISGSTGHSRAPLEVRHLHGILQWLHKAKAEMVENDRSKLQLESDVRLLYTLLDKAKMERRTYDTTILQLERSMATSNSRIDELNSELQRQRRSFTRVLRSDRKVYESRTEAAQKTAECRGRELKRVMSWVEKVEAKYAEALGKLSAQAEEVGAANLGDLEGFAQDMSTEVRQLQQDVAESMITRSRYPRQLRKEKEENGRKEKRN